VLRRVWSDHYNREKGTLFGKAFANDQEHPDRHSVSLASITSAEQLLTLTEEPERFVVVSLTVETYLEMGQEVYLSPTDGDPGHCDVIGAKTARVKDYLRRHATVVSL
jgi:hypothetical protein